MIKSFHLVKASSLSVKTNKMDDGSLPDSGVIIVDSSTGLISLTVIELLNSSLICWWLFFNIFLDKTSLIEFGEEVKSRV